MESLLLTIGFIGLALAVLTPLTKTASLVTLASFTIYFYAIGIENWLPLMLFILGLLLIVFEIFIPEFGIMGILGAILLIAGLYWTIGDVMQTVRDLSMAVVITTGLVVFLAKRGYSLTNVNKLILQTDLPANNKTETEDRTPNLYPGLVGKAQTPLRPSGKATFGKEEGPMFDVLSAEEFISMGTPIVIEQIQGTKILVRKQK
ncbi:hydrolase [Tetragenococcus koreensis]|uniref:Nodulation efficiency protein D n=1 Tax=Tetragenococcus koreensis TaxID=290335 RepID=A0AAN4UCA1_9ENTE|nr:hydrolase [Tetragenococcus koreensis]AYW44507.1 hydrolase [Tetragenococcus koreensis]MCF1584251.1 hydrolase [Tetragenococcus koreensis]MCF1613815.1 hydrolase [Tetragenococcus koreensis]MCF1616612.1 hydrolase [Tetragenococcus koreensis]MCF1619525.1 hydrolase [Tetragenococcus koreensis]